MSSAADRGLSMRSRGCTEIDRPEWGRGAARHPGGRRVLHPPHWDHLLWHARFGDVPRYATAAGARLAGETRPQQQEGAAESAPGIPLELLGLVTPLPADGGPVPGEIVEHRAHAVGHAALLLADQDVLLAGRHALRRPDPALRPEPGRAARRRRLGALDRLDEAARHVDVVVPGHGAVGKGPEVAARIAADRAYIDTLRRGQDPVDARLEADWLSGAHRSSPEQARGR